VLVLTATYAAAEAVGGFVTGSLALLADAAHMLTDVAGLGLALVAIHLAEQPATPARSYGYYRAEILAALANGVVLVAISAGVLFEAWQRFRTPPAVESGPMLAIAAGGLAVNALGVIVLRGGAASSLNVKGAYFEVLADLLASVGVIVAAAVMMVTGWFVVDPIISAAIGLFILPRTWTLLREAVGVLLEGTPAGVNVAALRETLRSVNGVAGVHDLHVWSLTSGVNAMSAHLLLAPGASHDEVRSEAATAVTNGFPVAHVTLQTEVQPCGDAAAHL
jgi:cobalt-zinc-cadmium efflux system protein